MAARAAIVQALWETGSESSSYSIRRIGELLPGSGNAPAIGASRYAAFTSIVLSATTVHVRITAADFFEDCDHRRSANSSCCHPML